MFNKLKRYLARKLSPYAEVKPQKYEIITQNVETLKCEIFVERGILVPEIIHKRELARLLANDLIPYINFETTEDIYTDSIRYRGVIRIVKER